jgi:Flavin containing amine oxidoreductase
MCAAWYMSESVAELSQENVLKATAIPAYDISAMTIKRVFSYWMWQTIPFLSVLTGDLQEVFIEPQLRELEALGVDIRCGAEVTRVRIHDGAVASVSLRDGSEVTGDVFALCTPFEVTRQWVTDELYALDPGLSNLQFLEAQPMAALSLHLLRKIPHLPREHVFLHRSYYGLSFIDVSQIWKASELSARAIQIGGQALPQETTTLSFIASNYAPLASLSAEGAKDALLEEIVEYLPIAPPDVESWEIRPNTQVPHPEGTLASPSLHAPFAQ